MKKIICVIFIVITFFMCSSNIYAFDITSNENIKVTVFTDKQSNKKNISINEKNFSYNAYDLIVDKILDDNIIEKCIIETDNQSIEIIVETNIKKAKKNITLLIDKNIYKSKSSKVIVDDTNYIREDFICANINQIIKDNKIKNTLFIFEKIMISIFLILFALIIEFRNRYIGRFLIISIIIIIVYILIKYNIT